MKRRLDIVSVGFALLIALLPASLLAQTAGAMLYAHGAVKVNGTNVGDSSSIFSGDQLDTAASSVVSINRAGSSVVVSPNSSVKYDGAAVEVLSGSARVSTSQGMSAHVGQVTVAPKDGTAKFEVVNLGDKVTVYSHSGSVTVTDGRRAIAVAAGSSYTVASGTTGKAMSQTPSAALMSPAPMFDQATGVDGTGPGIPFCPNFQSCPGRSHVSEIKPCRCPLP